MNAHRRVLRRALQLFLFVGILLGLTLLRPAPVAHATSLTVNSLLDTTVNGDGNCTLRKAITNANNNGSTYTDCAAGSGADTITFSVSGTITLGSTLPTITAAGGALTINGTGQTVTVSGGGAVTVMFVDSGASLSLNNLTIANGHNTTGGGGIVNSGTLTITNSTLSGNSTNQSGGGIANGDTLTITNSTFSGNSAKNGGGIFTNGSTLTITNSTFSGNSATASGGGIYSDGTTATITNSTFSGNSASASNGGGIAQNSGTVTLYNTIVANSTTGGNCNGTITNGGNNIDDGTTCSWGSSNGSMSSTNPLLGSLANNGGPTLTMALLPSSPAIDGVTFNVPNGCPSTDQRGANRPIGPRCDIGAYEAGYLFLPLIIK